VTLTDEQRAVLSHEGHAVVVACPGAGKTRVLVEKATHLILASPVPRVIVVTFTREAAREIRMRLAARLGERSGRVHADTFHALAIRHLLACGQLGALVGPGQQQTLLRRAWLHSGVATPWPLVARAVEARPAGVPAGTTSAADTSAIDAVVDHYLRLLEHHAALDFDQVIVQAGRRMREGRLPRLDCTHMLVDEAQDLDAQQLDWVFAHTDAGTILTAVGDDDQAIYGFRGSLGYRAVQSAQRRIGARLLQLTRNYRCRSEILGVALRLVRCNAARVDKALVAVRGAGGRVELVPAFDSDRELETLLQRVRGAPAEWAVIARSNRQLDDVESALVRAGIPYHRPGRSDFWEQEGPSLLVGLLRCPPTSLALGVALAHAGLEEHAIGRVLVDGELRVPTSVSRRDADPERVAAALRDALRRASRASPEDAVSAIADWLLVHRGVHAPPTGALEAAASALRRLSGSLPARLRLIASPQERSRDRDGVVLVTMHGAKGREYRRVWVPGLTDGIVPHRRSTDIDEERRLLYVAMTRAEDELVLSFPWTIRRSGSVRERNVEATPSRFLVDDLKLPLQRPRISLSHGVEA
jgi:superfamily I DNA/RNA helicase